MCPAIRFERSYLFCTSSDETGHEGVNISGDFSPPFGIIHLPFAGNFDAYGLPPKLDPFTK